MIATGDYSLARTSERSAEQVERAQANVAQVDLAVLVATFGSLLFRVAHSILRQRHEAEDVVQDTFVRVLEHRTSLADIRDPRVWLVRICWNLALDRRRRNRPDQIDAVFAETLVGTDVPADRALGEAQRLSALMAAIDRLPKPEKQALLLSAVEELSMTEIAAVIGKSESATRALIYRARTRLKQREGGPR